MRGYGLNDKKPRGLSFMTERKLQKIGVLAAASGSMWLACARTPEGPVVSPKPPEVTTSQVIEKQVVDFEEFTSRLDAVQNVEIRARVRGYLNAVHFTDGQEVKSGTLLFEIDPRTFEAELKNVEGQKAQWIAKRAKAQAEGQCHF